MAAGAFVMAMGGWGGIASLGMSILGGFSARKKAKKRKRRMRAAIGRSKGKLSAQKPGIDKYYNSLDEMLLSDHETTIDRNVEDFSNNALAFNMKSEKAQESGKGLVSGTVLKQIDVTKDLLAKDTQNSISDAYANFERTSLQLGNARSKEMQAIDDAIDQLDMQLASL